MARAQSAFEQRAARQRERTLAEIAARRFALTDRDRAADMRDREEWLPTRDEILAEQGGALAPPAFDAETFQANVAREGDVMRSDALETRRSDTNRIRNGIFDWMEKKGAAPEWAGMGSSVAELVPFVDTASGTEDTVQLFDQGRYGAGTLMGMATAADTIPGPVGEWAAIPFAAASRRMARGGARRGTTILDADALPVEEVSNLGHNQGPALVSQIEVDPLAPYRLEPGSAPQYLGAQADRSRGDIPRYMPPGGVPARMQRLEGLLADPDSSLRKQIDVDVEAGKKVGGMDWYNTEELRDWFVKEHGEEMGDEKWRDFISMVGATSTGAKVPQNLRMASFYTSLPPDQRRRVAARVAKVGEFDGAPNITPMGAAEELGYIKPGTWDPKIFSGYGHEKQRNHALNVLSTLAGDYAPVMPAGLTRAQQTKWLQKNPKIKGFGNDLTGNRRNIAADMHFMRMLAMADGSPDFLENGTQVGDTFLNELRMLNPEVDGYIKTRTKNGKTYNSFDARRAVEDGVVDIAHMRQEPGVWASAPSETEYAEFERLANNLAAEMGMTPAQFQASLWMGAGERTGLADASKGTFMGLLRKAATEQAARHAKAGKTTTPAEVLRDLVAKGGLVSILPLLNEMGGDEEEQREFA